MRGKVMASALRQVGRTPVSQHRPHDAGGPPDAYGRPVADQLGRPGELLREIRGGWLGLLLVGPCLACGASLHAHDGTIRLEHPNPAALLGRCCGCWRAARINIFGRFGFPLDTPRRLGYRLPMTAKRATRRRPGGGLAAKILGHEGAHPHARKIAAPGSMEEKAKAAESLRVVSGSDNR